MVALVVTASTAPPSAHAATPLPTTPELKLELSGEEPTGLYHDTQTLQTQTAILFTLKVVNTSDRERRVDLSWNITDIAGKSLRRNAEVLRVAPRGTIARRELFEAPRYGPYLVAAETAVRPRPVGDSPLRAALPFAVVPVPSAGFRPGSFFALSAPALLPPAELTFYNRLGARVLRSPWFTGEGADSAVTAADLDAQLKARLAYSIGTIGLLPAGVGGEAGEAVQSLVRRYRAIPAWEVTTPDAAARAVLAQAIIAGRPDATVLGYNDGESTISGLNGLCLNAWDDGSAQPRLVSASHSDTHPSATLRCLLAAGRQGREAGATALHLRDTGAHTGDPQRAAGDMARHYLTAVLAGAAGMSSAAIEPATIATERRLPQYAAAASFAALTHLLEDGAFVEDLYPMSPRYWGAVFRTPAAAVAPLWCSRPEDATRLTVQLQGATVQDVFGNEIARDNRGQLEIPLSTTPVYVISTTDPDRLARVLRTASASALCPVVVQVLPLTQRPAAATLVGMAPETAEALPSWRVRLQNVAIQPASGTLRLTPPPGWALAAASLNYSLQSGETKTYQFTSTRAVATADGAYAVEVAAQQGGNTWRWKQRVGLAVAGNVRRGAPMHVDGDLHDWNDAAWQDIPAETAARTGASVAVKWDKQFLYIAARVQELALRGRDESETAYRFWEKYDALEVVFGVRDRAVPASLRQPLRDTDYGFLLCPFRALPAGEVDGRVLRLWNPTLSLSDVKDKVRWGGAVGGALCVIKRAEAAGQTTYEARLPLAAIPELAPLERAAKDTPLRFTWVLHNDEGEPLQWSKTAGVFPWWDNTDSFAPTGRLYLAAQTPLGFMRTGLVDDGPVSKPVVVRPKTVNDTVKRQPRRPRLLPMPPALLPPAAVPEGKLIPPLPPPPAQTQ